MQCYACEGSGRDDPCMLGRMNDTTVFKIVTCEPNEFCHILRTVTLLNETGNINCMYKFFYVLILHIFEISIVIETKFSLLLSNNGMEHKEEL